MGLEAAAPSSAPRYRRGPERTVERRRGGRAVPCRSGPSLRRIRTLGRGGRRRRRSGSAGSAAWNSGAFCSAARPRRASCSGPRGASLGARLERPAAGWRFPAPPDRRSGGGRRFPPWDRGSKGHGRQRRVPHFLLRSSFPSPLCRPACVRSCAAPRLKRSSAALRAGAAPRAGSWLNLPACGAGSARQSGSPCGSERCETFR